MVWVPSQVRSWPTIRILVTYPDIIVLYALGTVVSLIGTGFLIGVRPYSFEPLSDLTDITLVRKV